MGSTLKAKVGDSPDTLIATVKETNLNFDDVEFGLPFGGEVKPPVSPPISVVPVLCFVMADIEPVYAGNERVVADICWSNIFPSIQAVMADDERVYAGLNRVIVGE